MNCLSCYKKHLSIAYIHSILYLKKPNDHDLMRTFSEIANSLQHGRNMTKIQFNDSMDIYNQIVNNNFEITENIAKKIYNAYYK